MTTGFLSGWRLVRLLPEQQARALFDLLADQATRRDGSGVRQLRTTLAQVCPELDDAALDELTRQGMRSYLRYWCEAFRLPSWPVEDLVARTRTVHEERLREPYAAGRGVLSALPHSGNWDWAGAWAGATGMPVTTVAERLRPERLYEEFVRYRASLGMRILPLTGGESLLPALEATLTAGGFVCLLADRDLSRSAIPVELCGRPARMPVGPALLARTTGAALVPTTCAYAGRDLEITFHEEVEVGEGIDGLRRATQ